MENKSPEAFRTISEVAEWLGVPAHVLRFWESRFGQVKPVKRAGGRRYYRPSDMELLGGIRKLLHEDGMTIRGVQKLLRENGIKYVSAMSPPIDQPADLKDVSVADAARQKPASADHVTESARPAPVFDNEAEDAVEVAAAQDTPAPTGTPQEPAGTDERDDVAEADASEPAMFSAPDAPDLAETADADSRKPVFSDGPEQTNVQTDEAEDGDTGEDIAASAEDDTSAPSPLDGPEAIDFYAHEAQPETIERAGPEPDAFAADIAADAEAAAAEDLGETGRPAQHAADQGDSPEIDAPAPPAEDVSLSADAQSADAEPAAETRDDVATERPDDAAPVPVDVPVSPTPPAFAPDSAAAPVAAGETASGEAEPHTPEPQTPEPPQPEPTATETPEPAPAAPERPTPAGADLVMPAIGPDPEDDVAARTSPALAAALRRHRARAAGGAAGASLNPALLQAYADRLQALSGRLGATPDGRRPF